MLGVMLFSASLCLPGFIMSERLLKRKRYMQFFSEFCGRVSLSFFDGGDNIFSIIKRESADDYRFLSVIDKKMISNKKELLSLFSKNGIESDDAEDVAQFFLKLGFGDIESQRRHCELYRTRFELRYKESAEECSNKGKVYKTMFLSLGLSAFIILI